MKKKVCLFLVFIIAFASLCGCSSSSNKKLKPGGDYKGWTIEIKNLWKKNTDENYVLNLKDALQNSSNPNSTKIVINYPYTGRRYDIYSVLCYKKVPQGRYHIIYEISYFNGESWKNDASLQNNGNYHVKAIIIDWETIGDLYGFASPGSIEMEVKID